VKPFDARGSFHTPTQADGLRRLAVRSAGVTVLSQSAGFMLQTIATVVLARLLGPADFGLLALVTTFSLLLMNVGLNGFTEAVLQRDHMDHALASNLFWINAVLGLLLAAAFAALGPLLARFYGEPRVTAVAGALALTILFTCLSVQHLALLKRAMRFPLVSANDVVARAVSVSVSVVLAVEGWGYWALVAGAVALTLSTAIGAWLLCRWVPGLPRRGSDTGTMVRFAMHTYARFLMGYCTSNLDKFLIGWRFGPAPLGLYRKAYDLFVMPSNQLSSPLTAVAVSALSRLTGEERRRSRHLLEALSTVAFVGMGLGAALTLVGRDFIRVLLGPRWDEAGRLFTLLGPGIGIMLVYGTHDWIHLSLGRPDRWVRWGVVELMVTTTLFVVALPWGPAGIALAWTASYWILTMPALWYAGQGELGIVPLADAVWKYVVAAAAAGSLAALLAPLAPWMAAAPALTASLARIATIAVVFGALYLGAVIVLHRGYAPLAHVAGLVRVMLAPRPARDFV
jgi:PST family polysaccharide transporter